MIDMTLHRNLVFLGLGLMSAFTSAATPQPPFAGVIQSFTITQPKDHSNNAWADLKYMKNVKWETTGTLITPDGIIQFKHPQDGQLIQAPIYISGARTFISAADIKIDNAYLGATNNPDTLGKLFGPYKVEALKTACDNTQTGQEKAFWRLTPKNSKPIYIAFKTTTNRYHIKVSHGISFIDDQDYEQCQLAKFDLD
ncbi:hypothetical protein EC844_105130 [Acinetobacter calcoaceticus]|uniref:Uncharacterized protein n=1 Tax=Acinetobacter calcoaceticus TaxID=471 RepID=A0A4R1XWK6_ACICA|nr:hypothetical protein EC844_105130 [Acinetobacter calcoaceticus]